jgi:SSS family solute:Na+ symporter
LTEAQRVSVLRWSTVLFAAFIVVVGVGTAAYMAYDPKTEIIPLVLGILGFTFGSLLAVFLVAVLTKHRGNDFGNVLAMICGFVVVVFFSNARLQDLVGFTTVDANGVVKPALLLAFPWRVTLGTLVTFAVAVCFRTPAERVETHMKSGSAGH